MRYSFRATAGIAVVAAVGCNALTGIGDLDVETGCPGCDGATPDVEQEEISRDEGAASTCPQDFADCNGDPADGCEANTRTDGQHCGGCGVVCSDGGLTCLGGQCGAPPSCKALLASEPGTGSGTYLIDPDGAGGEAAFIATCDMTTAGGGWTLVFTPTEVEYNTVTLDYTTRSPRLLNDAVEALLAYRSTSGGSVIGSTAVFALPSDWKTAAPFKAKAQDLIITVSLDGVPSSQTLRYGYEDFSTLCGDAWDLSRTYGRICIVGSKAPYYNGFATAAADNCSDSSQGYSSVPCGNQRRFTIGVR